nr:MAG TPA: hypothetical protein [Caudoviricetes sp.]
MSDLTLQRVDRAGALIGGGDSSSVAAASTDN